MKLIKVKCKDNDSRRYSVGEKVTVVVKNSKGETSGKTPWPVSIGEVREITARNVNGTSITVKGKVIEIE